MTVTSELRHGDLRPWFPWISDFFFLHPGNTMCNVIVRPRINCWFNIFWYGPKFMIPVFTVTSQEKSDRNPILLGESHHFPIHNSELWIFFVPWKKITYIPHTTMSSWDCNIDPIHNPIQHPRFGRCPHSIPATNLQTFVRISQVWWHRRVWTIWLKFPAYTHYINLYHLFCKSSKILMVRIRYKSRFLVVG